MTEQFQKVFGEYSTFEFNDLVNDIIDRIEDGDVIQAINDSLVYNVDRWEVIKHYENDPFNINVDEIIEQFIEEIEQFIEEKSRQESH